MLRIIALILCLLICGGWSHGRGPLTFYVSPTGSDSNSGLTQTAPWQTIAKVNSSTFNSGDTVAFQGGQTFSGSISFTQTTAPSNLTITSYGAGQPTISSGNSAACISVTNVAGFGVNNITCVGGGAGTNTTNGIVIANTGVNNWLYSGPTISNTTVSGYGLSCIAVYSNQASGVPYGFVGTVLNSDIAHDCTQNVTSSAIPVACVYVGYGPGAVQPNLVYQNNNSVFISGSTAFNCLGVASIGGGSWTGGGIVVPYWQAGTVTNNLVHDVGTNSGQNPVGISAFNSNGAVISFNEVYNSSSASNIDGQCLDASVSINETVQYNYLHHCQNGDLLLGDFSANPNNNVTVRFNILQGDTSGAIQAGSCTSSSLGCSNINIYNNTIAGNVSFGNNNTSNVPFSMNFSNNIFYQFVPGNTLSIDGSSLNTAGGGSVTFTGNDYFGGNALSVKVSSNTYTSLAAMQTAGYEKVGATPVGTTSNPNLTGPAGNGGTCLMGSPFSTPCPNAYTLTTSSPAGKGNGLNLNTIYGFNVGTQDFYGNAITNTTLPIGAAANK